MNLEAVLFDFHGVLSHDRFYMGPFFETRPEAYARLERSFFIGDKSLVNEWMRGLVGYRDVHRRIAEHVGVEAEALDRALIASVKAMRLEPGLLDLAAELKARGVRTAIITDNMDIFTKATVPHHGLGRRFDAVFNSADSGLLKNDEGGKIFDHALHRLGVDIANTLFIDDSAKNVELYRAKGGRARLYQK